MKKLRGQLGIVELMIGFIMIIIALALMPTIGNSAANAFSNASLFPDGDVAKTVGLLVPFIFIVVVIMSLLLMLNPYRREGA